LYEKYQKLQKKVCPKHIDINSQNEALNMLVKNLGHLAIYLSLKIDPFISFLIY
jgi:hypothetical protein